MVPDPRRPDVPLDRLNVAVGERVAPGKGDEEMEITAMSREQIIDEEHLRLLTIGHYIAGGMHIAFASLFIFHFVFMLVLSANPELFSHGDGPVAAPPRLFFEIFVWVLGLFILLGWLFGALTIYAGRCLKARTHRTFCMVMAVLNALVIPVGTMIGISTLIVLSRPSVKRLYHLVPDYASQP